MSADFPAYAPSEEHELLRRTVRELADAKIAPFAAEVDEESRFPQEALDALAANDLHAVHVPESYGGAGADALATVIVIEEVARACASSSLIPAVNKLGTVPVLLSGSEELKRRYLAPVARGEAMFSYALSEADAGSDAAGMKTRAVRDGEDWVLNGTKMWITNAGVSEFYTVMAVTDPSAGARGISAFVVERSDPGVSFGPKERKLGIKGSPTRQVILEDVRIPGDRIIGAEGTGFKTALATLDHTRITIAAQALGIAQGALDYAVGYVRERRQFGRPVADFQGVQFMLADMAMRLEGARQLTYHAAIKSERAMLGEQVADLTLVSSACKALASDVAMDVTTDAVQLLGGYGYTREFPVERMMRDAKITQIYEGTNQIQRMVIARQLLR
ncbi:acyl-CoA dehydrogenase [Actinomadura livida]|uniref:Probable acyl-CoA dehydrogenase fadE25 n=1 Tax=Actinomadura livida TaxID=79909 RepID=A0A7W7IJ79_9ACTN|nr:MULTISPECIES: acyl-CoA dehydrogenase [Actinomadura]MBB4778000.1 alkylation response protein AidB-like acyl-CoA dehydrogenase [Actinomadura catellatispora]GGT97317.1 acyl-CoA dehydrogenase [Actinomadura livida]